MNFSYQQTAEVVHYVSFSYQQTVEVGSIQLPSLVVCPPTLTGHWAYEVDKFVSKQHLSVLLYTGPPAERNRYINRAIALA